MVLLSVVVPWEDLGYRLETKCIHNLDLEILRLSPHGSHSILGHTVFDSDSTGTLSSGKKETGNLFDIPHYHLLLTNSPERIIDRGLRPPPLLCVSLEYI